MTGAPPADLARLAAVYAYAAERHRDQRMKGAAEAPYVNHACAVAALTAEAAPQNADAVAAAVLHDVVEDTDATLDDLAERFGPEIAALVGWLTDPPEWGALPTEARKSRQAEKISEAPAGAKTVKIADQTTNLEGRWVDFDVWPGARRRSYLDGARRVVDACRGAAPALEARFDRAADALEARIDAVEKDAEQGATTKETTP